VQCKYVSYLQIFQQCFGKFFLEGGGGSLELMRLTNGRMALEKLRKKWAKATF